MDRGDRLANYEVLQRSNTEKNEILLWEIFWVVFDHSKVTYKGNLSEGQ